MTMPEADTLLAANAVRVFSEADAGRRRAALADLWAADGILYEEGHVVEGIDAISRSVGDLLASLPPGTRFEPDGPAVAHNGVGRLRWQAVGADGEPAPVTGTDVAFFENGKIARLYVFLDPAV